MKILIKSKILKEKLINHPEKKSRKQVTIYISSNVRSYQEIYTKLEKIMKEKSHYYYCLSFWSSN